MKIEQVDDPEFPYVITVYSEEESIRPAWYRGKTLQEAMEMFYKSFTDKNLRYWFKLRDV